MTTVFDTWSLFKDFNNALVGLKKIVVSVLKSILSNSSRLSTSSRRPEDVKIPRLALFTERGRCWGYPWDCKLSILFVLYDELFCLKDAVV